MKRLHTLVAIGAATITIGSTIAIAQNTQPRASSPVTETASMGAPQAMPGRAHVIKAGFGGRRDRRSSMMEIMRQADSNNDDALTQAELDAYVEATVASADANKDGDVTLQEFETIWLEMTRRRMADAFQRLDDDASGAITAAERNEAFGDVVTRLDRNDDGKLDAADRRDRDDRGEHRRDGRRGGHHRHNR